MDLLQKLKHARNELDSYKKIVADLEAQIVAEQNLAPDFVGTHNADGFKVVVPKRVHWNEEYLAEKYKEIGETADEYITVKYSVSESKYKAWPEAIAKEFEPARTFKTGKPSIKIVEKDD